jgi:hypothetical protein
MLKPGLSFISTLFASKDSGEGYNKKCPSLAETV